MIETGHNKLSLSMEIRKRTKQYAATAIRLYVRLPVDREEIRVCGKHFLRSATSVAVNVREAYRAWSNAELTSELEGILQETDKSRLWLDFLRAESKI